jgi:hypothetical protein
LSREQLKRDWEGSHWPAENRVPGRKNKMDNGEINSRNGEKGEERKKENAEIGLNNKGWEKGRTSGR